VCRLRHSELGVALWLPPADPSGRRPSTVRRTDVAAVLEVVRHRGAGLALEAAVRRATTPSLRSKSVYAELRRQHPEPTPQLLSKSSLVALSHSIEDECCARAEEPLLFAGFPARRLLRDSYARWVELARTARVAVIFAALPTPLAATPWSAHRGGAAAGGPPPPRVVRSLRRAWAARLHGSRRATGP
jgi:hypothetical protein